MKKTIPVLLLCLLLTFAACGGDSADTPTPTPDAGSVETTADVYGTWVQTMEVTALGEGVTDPATMDAAMTLTLNKDGSGLWSTDMGDLPSIDRALTFTIAGDTITFTFDEGDTEEYTLTLTAHILTLQNNRGTLNFVLQ